MHKSPQYKVSSQQISAVSFIARFNTPTVRMTIPFVLAGALMIRYVTTQSARTSAAQPLNSLNSDASGSILIAAKSSTQQLFQTGTNVPNSVLLPATSSTQKTLKLRTLPPPRPNWAIAKGMPIPSRLPGKENTQVAYNLDTPPDFKRSQELQKIVNQVVSLAAAKGLPKKPLSITLIDAKTGETAGYQQDTPRYPASVVKTFWMTVLYSQIESGVWKNEEDFTPYIAKMIKESDNEAASYIVDQITATRSQPRLKSEKFKNWKDKREQVNRFFRDAGYKRINVSQKTFPLYYLNLPEPKGSESQMLGKSNWNPNRITSRQAARLMYEICYLKTAVSQQASQKMCGWLERDLNPKAWQDPDLYAFNPVRGFLGQSLSKTNVSFHSKAGWTSRSRAEMAMVSTGDEKTTYILTVFGHSPAYSNNVDIFPQISRLVYKRMTARDAKPELKPIALSNSN
ncbi:MAG: class A beta-lactamase-related serine hydrolase [Fischerella sp. CENA71]|nr:class A beta-lactamase-related serine hydrolase [Fischerella sp. CENA71]